MASRRNFGLGSIVSIIFGLLLAAGLVTGGLFMRSFTQPIDGGVVVPGRAVVIVEQRNDGGSVEVPYIEFVDPVTASTHRMLDYMTAVGDESIEVSLLPGDPSSARLIGGSELWLSLVALGLAALVAVVGAVWWSSKPTSKQPQGMAMALPEDQLVT